MNICNIRFENICKLTVSFIKQLPLGLNKQYDIRFRKGSKVYLLLLDKLSNDNREKLIVQHFNLYPYVDACNARHFECNHHSSVIETFLSSF